MYGVRDRARTRAVEVMDVMDVIHFEWSPMTTRISTHASNVLKCGPNDVTVQYCNVSPTLYCNVLPLTVYFIGKLMY